MYRFHQVVQKQQDLLSVGRRPIVKEPVEVEEKGVVSQVVELLPFRREIDLKTSPVVWVRGAPDEPLRLELIDHARHCAELNLKLGGELAHGLRTVEIEASQTVRLGDGQGAICRRFLASELVKRRQAVESFVETEEIVVVGSHA